MSNYKEYLEKESYSITTIKSYLIEVEKFTKWCTKRKTTPTEIDYKSLLEYPKYLTKKGNSKKTINHKLGTLKSYFNYLIKENYRADNPAESIVIKGVKRKLHYNLLEPEELEDLYYSFESDNVADKYHKLCAKRNKVIVGLMVYQGLNTNTLIRLKLEHIEVYKGKIQIPSTTRTNARELELKPWQVIELLEYIKEVREEIIRRKKIESERLFIPNNARLGNTIQHILKKLKKVNHKVFNHYQIRASVITNWTKQHNLRKVQYLSGHRYISSTEQYLQDDLESMQEVINMHHPIS
ncbi:tyrosine-type recombinase/integrase [Tenacibaculum halocynthiae]|uniref:tyrosine-type recombinase/integrase n=1 Tax=Tenacibaculum halocynthiae TaxID=1254437 RepID=UPI003895D4D2